jgi:low affinity Fe/Cu permease
MEMLGADWLLAITAVWLFFNIMLCNSLQARYPALLIPTILYNIFVIVQFTSCSRFTTWKQCWDLIYLTVRCYYSGVAISFVSGMIIYPVTCRSEIFEVQEKYIEAVRSMLRESARYLGNLKTTPTFPTSAGGQIQDEVEAQEGTWNGAEIQQKMVEVKALYTKMRHELAMAKREIAWGKLRARDINAITDLCRHILMPL